MRTRVLEVLASLRRAGAERIAASLATGLDPSRFEAGVISLYPAFENGFEPELKQAGVPVWHLGKRRGLDPRTWARLAGIFRRFEPEIIHTHSYVLNYVLPAWASRRQASVIHTVHNLAEKETTATGKVIHRAAFRAGALPVAISEEVARSFQRVYGFAPVATIPNGAEVRGGFRPEARRAWRLEHGFAPGDLLIASVARFEPQKNPLGLIRAFARALRDCPAARLVMAGQGSLIAECRRLVSELGLTGRVRFIGVCRDVPEMLSACDLFALASHWEGSPVVVIEAMAARLPLVATAVGGVPELVEDGVTGVLVQAGDCDAFAAALGDLARDAERRQAMGAAAGRRAELFDTRAMVQSYAALFERVAQGSVRCRG